MRGGETSRWLSEFYGEQSEAYERLWAPVLLPCCRRLASMLDVAGASDILEIGCGVGVLLRELRDSAPNARVVGTDRSAGMVARADRSIARAVADARAQPFRDASFDVAIMAFMLFHVPDPVAALREARRVVRPGGQVGVTTWSRDATGPAVDIWDRELAAAGAPALDPTLARHDLMDTPEKVRGLAAAAGLDAVEIVAEPLLIDQSLDEFVARRMHLGQAARRLAALAPDAREQCIGRAVAALHDAGIERCVQDAEVLHMVCRRP